ncbi:MAG: hypothetical protein JXR95_10450 [Deltaproteobacteria bacterium]|nr:hypothetical protein [Deltaproteobacteria bacterium]
MKTSNKILLGLLLLFWMLTISKFVGYRIILNDVLNAEGNDITMGK